MLHTHTGHLVSPKLLPANKYKTGNVECTYKRNIVARSHNHSWRGKTLSITTYSECVSVALVIRHAKRMPRFTLSSLTCPAIPHFSTLSHKRHDFRPPKNIGRRIMFWFSLLSENFPFLRRTQRDVIRSVLLRSSCKNRYSCHILMTLEFSRQSFQKFSNIKCR